MERCMELEDLTRRFYQSLSGGDITFLEQHLSRGACVLIGTAPEEWWDDYRSAVDAIRLQMEKVGDALTLVADGLQAYRYGDVGWIADKPKFRLGSTEVPCRHTAVFIREGGEWKIVQQHLSIGVANEAAFGAELRRVG